VSTSTSLRISIVGPCSSGKSTLREALYTAGYHHVRNPAQEHSYVPDMWQKLSKPDVLIYLDVDYPTTIQRRPQQDLGPGRVETQRKRLAHARQHADLYIDTSPLSPDEISRKTLAFLATLAAP
jgi:deoxyadenosine/deoxycytidine kinase